MAGEGAEGPVAALVRAWEARDPAQWQREPARYAAHARRALALGAPGFAFDICGEARARFPGDRELGYLAALALANGGASGEAARLLRELLAADEGALQSDLLSLAGRIAKERWSRLPEGAERREAGEQARGFYRRAFERSRDWFPGINAATMSLLTGEAEESRRLALEVRALCGAGEGDAWRCATLGEAALLLGEPDAAARWYRKAAALAGRRHGDVASMRRQVKLLAPMVSGAEAMLASLPVPRVAVFTGHMIDAPGRTAPRFPPHLAPAVGAAIARAIEDNELGFGYCAAACGADILFAEQMLARGAELDIVLPFRREDFVATSVAFAGSDWAGRFERVLAGAASVSYGVEESHLGDDVLYAYAAELTVGLAALRAAQLETEPVLLAVAEPDDEGKIGGTVGTVRRWQAQGRRAVVLDLRAIRESGAPSAAPMPDARHVAAVPRAPGLPWGRRQIRTMLFADMEGYSRLPEQQTPEFFVHFLGAIERALASAAGRPAFGNTWGDGLYLVFESAAEGADFALRLRDEIARVDWAAGGLPADMGLRIGMHTGPVFRTLDPIIKQENYFGSHVTRAARIEPVAARGSIYVSEQMAAALAASGGHAFACDYLGPLGLAKNYGSGRLYRLRRSGETE
ncbi:MAG TPA: TRAFs-binding domain-containing protein [Burkholderiales bacterium]|nr:TRAFs-binding domain-containing protein [Burkholderiales bacterium]